MCIACLERIGRTITAGVVDSGCAAAAFAEMRGAVLPLAEGVVVEIGFGSGHSLSFYDPGRVSRVEGVEPDAAMLRRADLNLRGARVTVELVNARGEALPFGTGSADTVVIGYVLCTVPDPQACLAEAARVLKPGGRLLFCEHGLASGAGVRRIQRVTDGLWRRIAGGCTLLRNPLTILEGAGFQCGDLRQTCFPGLLGLLGQHVGGWAVLGVEDSRKWVMPMIEIDKCRQS